MTQDLFRGVLPFVHVAEERSFRRAAARLGVTPAAVSKAIRALEDDLGAQLVERTSRRVALTPAGEAFFERCRDAVEHVRAGRELVARAQREPKGTLRVTLSVILGKPLLAALPRFVSRYPALDVHLQLSDRVSTLVDENLDVALRVGALGSSDLVARRLTATRWVTVASPAYLARRGEPQDPAALADHDALRFITPQGRPAPWVFEGGEPPTAAGRVCMDHGDLLVDAALAGLGVAQVLDFMVTEPLRDGRLVAILTEHAADGPPIVVLTSRGRRASRRVRAFVDFVLDALGA